LSHIRWWVWYVAISIGPLLVVGKHLRDSARSEKGVSPAFAVFAVVLAVFPLLFGWWLSSRPPPIPSDPVVSVRPQQVRSGDEMKLVVEDPPGIRGLRWDLEHQTGNRWQPVGFFKVGVGKQWASQFYFKGDTPGGVIEDIGFTGTDVMDVVVPSLDLGTYRVGTDFLRQGKGSVEKRTEWHYAQFEVVPQEG
jgi:hypothetical protein